MENSNDEKIKVVDKLEEYKEVFIIISKIFINEYPEYVEFFKEEIWGSDVIKELWNIAIKIKPSMIKKCPNKEYINEETSLFISDKYSKYLPYLDDKYKTPKAWASYVSHVRSFDGVPHELIGDELFYTLCAILWAGVVGIIENPSLEVQRTAFETDAEFFILAMSKHHKPVSPQLVEKCFIIYEGYKVIENISKCDITMPVITEVFRKGYGHKLKYTDRLLNSTESSYILSNFPDEFRNVISITDSIYDVGKEFIKTSPYEIFSDNYKCIMKVYNIFDGGSIRKNLGMLTRAFIRRYIKRK